MYEYDLTFSGAYLVTIDLPLRGNCLYFLKVF